MPTATLASKGLLPERTFQKVSVDAADGAKKYLRIQNDLFPSLLVSIFRPAHEEILLINSRLNSTSTRVDSCEIIQIGKQINTQSARLIRTISDKYIVEISLSETRYMRYASVFNLMSYTYSVTLEADPYPDEDIQSSVNATIKYFNDL